MSTKSNQNGPKPKEVHVQYRFPDDYNPCYINGAWGGTNPHGEIAAHFYMERLGLPIEDVHQVDDAGQIISTRTVHPKDHHCKIIRMVTTGVIMNLDTARAIHKWLGDKIEFAEKQQQARIARKEVTPNADQGTV